MFITANPTTTEATTTLTTTAATTAEPTTVTTAKPTAKDATPKPTTKDATPKPTTKDATPKPTTKDATPKPTTKDATAKPTKAVTAAEPKATVKAPKTTKTVTTTEATTTKPTTTETTTTEKPTTTELLTTTEFIDINECESNPCHPRATCLDKRNHYKCSCPFGYDGVHCEREMYPKFNYTDMRNIRILELTTDGIGLHHPYYKIAQLYNPMSYNPKLASSSSPLLKHSTVTTDVGRAAIGTYFKMAETKSWIDPTESYTGNNLQILQPLGDRRNGFALSFWVYLDETAKTNAPRGVPATLYNSGRSYNSKKIQHVQVAIILRGNNRAISFRVYDNITNTELRVPNKDIEWNQWAHLAITWRRDLGFSAFMNGNLITNRHIKPMTGTHLISEPWKIALGANDRYGTLAMSPVIVADFVSWPRYLYPFEIHHLFGMTEIQYSNLREGTRYWTTDFFILRDQKTFLTYKEFKPPTAWIHNMSIPEDQPLVLLPSESGRGRVLHINGTAGHWFHLGVEEGSCLSDPIRCPNGATVTIVCKLVRPADDDYHFVFSSGAQSTRGFALYQRGSRIGAIIADGDSKWTAEMTAPVGWAHIGLSWQKQTGLNVYVDGKLQGADLKGVRKIRETDADTRVIIGRRNDFLGGYSDVYFKELAFRQQFVEAFKARDIFKVYGNSIYDTAAYYWNYRQLVTSSYELMTTKATEDESFIGARGETLMDNPEAVHLKGSNSFINLGNFKGDCICDPSLCHDGFTVSFWVKIPDRNFTEPAYLFSSGGDMFSISTNTSTGLAVYIEGESLHIDVVANHAKWMLNTSKKNIPDEEWTNIGISWDASDTTQSSIQLWIDGIKPTLDYRTFEEIVTNETAWNSKATNVVIGRHNFENKGHIIDIKIHNLAIWETVTTDRKVSRLLGLSDPEFRCLRDAVFCLTFEYPAILRYPINASAPGISFTDNHNFRGRALCTDGIEGSILLGNYSGRCPSNPEMCGNGFTFATWLKLFPLPDGQDKAYIVSLGAENEDEIGFVLTQTRQALEVTVADDDTTWEGSAASNDLNYGHWIYFGLVWSSRRGLQISIDGKSIGILLNRITHVRHTEDVTVLTLGKGSGAMAKSTKVCFDDVALYIPDDNEDLPPLTSLTGKETSSYTSADEHFDVTDPNGAVKAVNTEATTDRNNDLNGAADTSSKLGLGYLNLGSFAGKCVSDPGRCTPEGVTISTWLRMGTTQHFKSATNPGRLGYILSSGAQHDNSRGFAATYDGSQIEGYVTDGITKWKVKFTFDLEQDWHNFALTWSSQSGLTIFIDGSEKASDRVGTPLSTIRNDFHTTLHLGKRNDGNVDYLGAAFDDPAIWYHAIHGDDPQATAIVKGEASDPVVVTKNHNSSEPDTGKPSCQILHEADCARTMTELFNVISEEAKFNDVIMRSTTLKMQALSEPENVMSSADLKFATLNLKKLTDVPLPDRLNEAASQDYLQEYLKIASGLLDTNRSDEWYTVHQMMEMAKHKDMMKNIYDREMDKMNSFYNEEHRAGTTSIIRNTEFYAMNISQRTDSRDAKLLCETDNIVLTIDKVSSSTFSKPYKLPSKTERRWRLADESWRQIEDSIELPAKLLDYAGPDGVGEGSLIFSVFKTLQDMVPTETIGFNKARGQTPWFNSYVMSAEIDPKLEKELEEPVIIAFKHVVPLNSSFIKKPSCGFWNFDAPNTPNGAWDNKGCQTVESNDTHTTCHCYHLTHFVIVMEPIVPEGTNWDLVTAAWIIRIFGILSVWFLIMLLYNFTTTYRLRTLRHTIHLHQCIAALMATLALVGSDFARLDEVACAVVGACIHFFYLVYIFWVSIEFVQLIRDMWYGLHKSDAPIGFAVYRSYMGWYTLYAWGIPLAVTGVTFGMTLPAYAYTEHELGLCWLSNNESLLWAFAGPCCIALSINMILISFIKSGMSEKVRTQDKTTGFRSGVRGSSFLTIVFAATWLMGCSSIYGGPVTLYFVFAFLCASLGIFMFICHGMANIEVRAVICQSDPDTELSAVQAIYIPPSSEPTSEDSGKLAYQATGDDGEKVVSNDLIT